MSHVLSFTCIEQQHVELLPERTVLSMFSTQGSGGGRGDNVGQTLLAMLGISQGGHGTPGADGQPSHGDS